MSSPSVVLAGSVTSSRRTLEALIRHKVDVRGVLGLNHLRSSNVSGYTRLDDLATTAGIPYEDFANINDTGTMDRIRRWTPEVLFVAGLSQMVRRELLDLPSLGAVGFHPTCLPKGRGRAPIAWIILDNVPAAATFFVMSDAADQGPILAQQPFEVTPEDYAADVVAKVLSAIDAALDLWLPRLIAGEWKPIVQNEKDATYYGVRRPEDGLIDWRWASHQIQTLVRATSRPHPGAFTYYKGMQLVVWRAVVVDDCATRGVIGRVIAMDRGCPVVQTGAGALRLDEWEIQPDNRMDTHLPVGALLGLNLPMEFSKLDSQIRALERRLTSADEEGTTP